MVLDELSISVAATESEIPGRWVAYCKEFDVLTHGASRMHAVEMLIHAAKLIIEFDIEHGLDPRARLSR